ncbi:MAG: hypothetical protein ACTHMB_00970, partial [Candidatus Binatia bacterium]
FISQSKNDLGLSLTHLPIVVPRPNLKAIFPGSSLFPMNLHTVTYITQRQVTLTGTVYTPIIGSQSTIVRDTQWLN